MASRPPTQAGHRTRGHGRRRRSPPPAAGVATRAAGPWAGDIPPRSVPVPRAVSSPFPRSRSFHSQYAPASCMASSQLSPERERSGADQRTSRPLHELPCLRNRRPKTKIESHEQRSHEVHQALAARHIFTLHSVCRRRLGSLLPDAPPCLRARFLEFWYRRWSVRPLLSPPPSHCVCASARAREQLSVSARGRPLRPTFEWDLMTVGRQRARVHTPPVSPARERHAPR